MFAYKTVVAPTTAAVNSPVEVLTTTNDLMPEAAQSVVIQASALGIGETVTVWEGKGDTPIWEQVRVWPTGTAVVVTNESGSVCLEGRGVRYGITKSATAAAVGVYAVIQYEPR